MKLLSLNRLNVNNKNFKSKKLIKLEAIRGFAAIYVVFHHLFSSKFELIYHKTRLFSFGQEAVILFFILSGFVIFYSFERSKDKSFKLYFLKRFLRIYIPLLIVFIVDYLLKCYYKNGIASFEIWTLLGNVFMLQDVSSLKPNVIIDPFLGNSPLWSLSYEWWFYMLFFIIYKQFKGKSSLIVYIVGCISSISYIIYPNFINRELMYLVIWWSGADIAKLYLNKQDINIKSLRYSLISILFCSLVMLYNIYNSNMLGLDEVKGNFGVNPWLEFRHFSFAFIAIVFAVIWRKYKWIGFNLTLGLFESLASVSFGIYIAHMFLFVNASFFDSMISNSLLRYLVYFIISVLFAYVIERIIYVKLNRYILNRIYIKKN